MSTRTVQIWAIPLTFSACGPTATDTAVPVVETELPYTIVDTDQLDCYSATGTMGCPAAGEEFHGQDGQHLRFAPSYDSDGEIVIDEVTGLVWQWEQQDKVAFSDAEGICDDLELGGITSWRVPSIKEAYSLIQFDGATGQAAPDSSQIPDDAVPYIDTAAFDFAYGDASAGERYIDTQFITTNVYVSTVFADNAGVEAGVSCFFGANLADGRIKCYPTEAAQTFQLRCVAGGDDYGLNDLEDQGDGTIADHATGLLWAQADSGDTMDWGEALAWCEGLETAGYDDWRLPEAKELQSIVDYTRSPDTTGSAAIDPMFDATPIVDEVGDENWGWYWTSTTHLDGEVDGENAVYVAFGEALGATTGTSSGQDLVMDVHGAGAQRSDPKTGDPGDYPMMGMGPQGDVRRVFNLARCVRELD
ncbi:MAG: DUF1566 domain-containing protein [Pseudomonadota bacterium]